MLSPPPRSAGKAPAPPQGNRARGGPPAERRPPPGPGPAGSGPGFLRPGLRRHRRAGLVRQLSLTSPSYLSPMQGSPAWPHNRARRSSTGEVAANVLPTVRPAVHGSLHGWLVVAGSAVPAGLPGDRGGRAHLPGAHDHARLAAIDPTRVPTIEGPGGTGPSLRP